LNKDQILIGYEVETGYSVTTTVDDIRKNKILLEGDSGSGKSHLDTVFIEGTDKKAQRLIIDIEGEYFPLKNNFEFLLIGKSTNYVKVDIELNINDIYVEKLAIKLLESSADAIIDLSEYPTEATRFVSILFKSLLQNAKKMKRPLLIFLDEAHIFCLTPDTEILTKTGWKNHDQIKVGELAYSYNLANKILELNPIERIIEKQFNGKLVSLKNNDSIDALVTPEHRVVCSTRTTSNKKYSLTNEKIIHACDLPTSFTIPITGKFKDQKLEINNELLFLIGIILTDGTIHYYHNKENYYYEISQSKQPNVRILRKEIKKYFGNFGEYIRTRTSEINKRKIKPTTEHTFRFDIIATKEINFWLNYNSNRIPRKIIENASKEQLKILYNGIMFGDGTRYKTKNNYELDRVYCGQNSKFADDVQELCFKIGLSSVVKLVPQNNQYVVLVSHKRKSAWVRKITTKHYNGLVWDITIKHGAFVARRNGKIFITGNCPEKGTGSEESLKAVIEMVKRGRKRGIGLICATQAMADFSKNVVRQLRTRFIGNCTLESDVKAAARVLGFDKNKEKELSELGEDHYFFVVGKGIKVNGKKPKHMLKIKAIPTKTQLHDFEFNKAAKIKEVNPDAIKLIKKEYSDIPELIDTELTKQELLEKQNIDYKKLVQEQKSRIFQLEKIQPKQDPQALQKAHDQGLQTGRNEVKKILDKIQKSLSSNLQLIENPVHQLGLIRENIINSDIFNPVEKIQTSKIIITEPKKELSSLKITSSIEPVNIDGVELTGPETKILTAIVQRTDHSGSKNQIALMSGYSIKSSGFLKPLGHLRKLGLITYDPNTLTATDSGISVLCDYTPIPTDSETVCNYWLNKVTGPERRILKPIIDAYAGMISKEDCAEQAGYSVISSGFLKPLGHLRKLGLIEYVPDGLKATKELFPDQ